MGSKTKILDPKALEHIYSTSINFKTKAQDAADDIKLRLNQLTDPAFLDGMSGGQGEACVEAIKAGASALEDLMNSITLTANFIDEKLVGAVQLAKDKHGFDDKKDANKRAGERMNLKR